MELAGSSPSFDGRAECLEEHAILRLRSRMEIFNACSPLLLRAGACVLWSTEYGVAFSQSICQWSSELGAWSLELGCGANGIDSDRDVRDKVGSQRQKSPLHTCKQEARVSMRYPHLPSVSSVLFFGYSLFFFLFSLLFSSIHSD